MVEKFVVVLAMFPSLNGVFLCYGFCYSSAYMGDLFVVVFVLFHCLNGKFVVVFVLFDCLHGWFVCWGICSVPLFTWVICLLLCSFCSTAYMSDLLVVVFICFVLKNCPCFFLRTASWMLSKKKITCVAQFQITVTHWLARVTALFILSAYDCPLTLTLYGTFVKW